MRVWINFVSTVLAASICVTASAADELPVLSWQAKDVKDPMTDVVTQTAVSRVDFANGTKLEASAKCDKIGAEFMFDMFSGGAPMALAWQGKETHLRVRIDNGDVRVTAAAEQRPNETGALFYEPNTARTLFTEAFVKRLGSACDPYLCQPIMGAQVKVMMDELGQRAEGTLATLANAKSIRLELPLADGRADVFELNPQDEALASVVRHCATDLSGPSALRDERRDSAKQSTGQPQGGHTQKSHYRLFDSRRQKQRNNKR
jgi:hypothetical protein